jgi:hypothetical protein
MSKIAFSLLCALVRPTSVSLIIADGALALFSHPST